MAESVVTTRIFSCLKLLCCCYNKKLSWQKLLLQDKNLMTEAIVCKKKKTSQQKLLLQHEDTIAVISKYNTELFITEDFYILK